MVSRSRAAEIQRMFDEIGLGLPEERKRLAELGAPDLDEPPEDTLTPQEHVFIRIENNTADPVETSNG
jgi:hypothetical protein